MDLLADSVVRYYRNPQWYQALFTLLGIVVSLLLAYIAIFGREKFFNLKFSYLISKIDQPIDGNNHQIFRLKIKNQSKRHAKNVVVTVTEIRDKKQGRYYVRNDFIHMPLSWTHAGEKKERNFAVNEEAFLDVGLYDPRSPGLQLFTNPRTSAPQLFDIKNDAIITLRVLEYQGFVQELKLRFAKGATGGGLEIIDQKITNKS